MAGRKAKGVKAHGLTIDVNPSRPRMGRPTVRTTAVVEEIIERVSLGEPLAKICRDDHMPSVSAFYEWLNQDKELDGRFARARELGHDAIAAQALDIIDTPPAYKQTAEGMSIDQGDVQHRKLQFEGRLKLLAKWDRRYADRQQIEHSGKLALESLVAGDGEQ